MRKLHNHRPALLGALLCLLLATGVTAQESVTFEGLEHAALGGASLSLGADGLAVESLGTSGEDGVHITLPGSIFWTAETGIESTGNGDDRLHLTAHADGLAISTFDIQQEGAQLNLSATFTAGGVEPTYSLLVYNGGVFRGGVGGLNPFDPISIAFPWINPCWLDPWPCIWDPPFAAFDSCEWRLILMGEATVSAQGQSFQGDEIRLVEEIVDGGQYPYTDFDGISVQGTVESITLHSETVQ